ncbi:MAG: response regulator [bacterium]|nr:response regulator [bacterium]
MKSRSAAIAILIGVAFYGGAKLGWALSLPPDHIATFWPPNAFVLAALLLTQRRRWWIWFLAMAPAYLAGALQNDYSVQRTLIFFAANCTEILLAGTALRLSLGSRIKLDRLRDMVQFLLWAVLIAPAISASMASLVTISDPEVSPWLAWRVWFLGDALAHLALTPVLILWIDFGLGRVRDVKFARLTEASALGLSLLVVGMLSLGIEIGSRGNTPALLYSPLPFLLWATIRFGSQGASSAVFLVTLLAIWNAINGSGPFTANTTADNVLSLQLFLMAFSVPVLLLGSLLSERDRAREELERYQGQLEASVKESSVELRESQGLLRRILESMTDGVLVLDEDFHYVFWNNAMERISKVPRERLIGSDLRPWDVFPHLREGVEELMRQAMRGDGSSRNGIPFRLPDGTEGITDEIYLPLQDDAGRINGIVGVIRDVTQRNQAEKERVELERQVQQAQKMESLGVLAGGIAHDFNNLLMGILGHAELAMGSLESSSPARTDVNGIIESTKRASDLTNQMLAYSGKGRFVVEDLDLSRLVREMINLLEVSVSKKAALRYELEDGLPAIEADGTQIRQVVMNLITNASEAIGDRSGVISIRTGLADCDREYFKGAYPDEKLSPGAYAYLEVADTGIGMDADTLARIFEPFYTTKFTGRGLGLAAVLGIMRGHRGAIKIHSELGQGTVFKALIPAVDRSATVVADEPLEAPGWHPTGLALLVDDNETVLAVTSQYLERMGCEVITATDGREALEVFEQRSDEISFVILDLTMPHMDGDECFRELRRVRSDVLVILTSGYNEQELTQRFVGHGFAGFLQKPYGAVQLTAKLRGIFPGSSPRNSEDPL